MHIYDYSNKQEPKLSELQSITKIISVMNAQLLYHMNTKPTLMFHIALITMHIARLVTWQMR